MAIILLQLVGTLQIGMIGAGVQARADPEAVDGRGGLPERLDRIFVEIAAGKDLDVPRAACIALRSPLVK